VELGIANYTPDDAAIAQVIGARWARITVGCLPDLVANEAAIESAYANGMHVIAVAGATADTICVPMPSAYYENLSFVLDYYSREIGAVEVLGSVEGVYLDGKPAHEWYGEVLREAYSTIVERHPFATVLNGGFGRNADPWFLNNCLTCGDMDAVAINPFAYPVDDLDEYAEQFALNLQQIGAAGYTVWATVFGVPTVPEPVDPEYGRKVLPGDVHAIGADEALDWYKRLLTELEIAGVEACCLMARDLPHYKTPAAWCGLRYADGTDKPWTQELLLWLQERPAAQVLIDLPPEEASEWTLA
jgi:hypothetical protein